MPSGKYPYAQEVMFHQPVACLLSSYIRFVPIDTMSDSALAVSQAFDNGDNYGIRFLPLSWAD